MIEQNENGPYVSSAQLAKRFGVNRISIARWSAAGVMPAAIRIGGILRWRLEDIQEFEQKLLQIARSSAPKAGIANS